MEVFQSCHIAHARRGTLKFNFMACALWLLHNIYYVTYNVVLLHPQLQTPIFVHALVSENIFDLELKNAISDNLVYSLFTTFLGWRG